MSEEKWKMLTDEILPLAEALCEIADRYDLELPSITADSDGYFNFCITDDGIQHWFYRANNSNEICNEIRLRDGNLETTEDMEYGK